MPIVDTWHLDTCHIGRRVLVYDSVTSTNDIALEQPLGTVVLADEQTAGRGQFGRMWHSPPQTSVLQSVKLDPLPEFRRPVILTAWAAVAVAETVRYVTGETPTIRWPNDLLLFGKKIAGILIEQKSVVIAGVGLNVSQTAELFAAAELPDAGSLASITGRSFDREEIARQLIIQLDAEYSALLDGRLADLETRWAEYLGSLGRSVVAEMRDDSSVTGLLRELTFDSVTLESETGPPVTLPPESIRHIY